ncbi:aldehyde dehydrogenase (NAD+) [Bradyrhizobium sp. USDA 4509]
MQTHKLDLPGEVDRLLTKLNLSRALYSEGELKVRTPVTGEVIGQVEETTVSQAVAEIEAAARAFREWRLVPAPRRGELVRLFGEELRANKETLGRLVSIEVGKIISEGLGEIQEMIDMCKFAVGLSRQLYGLTMATERHEHRIMETWHPMGVVGIISSFNFPVSVWASNAAIALVCGNSIVWKPSEKTPLTALAAQALLERALKRFNQDGGNAPEGLSTVLVGGREIGEVLVDHPKVPVVSATGSTTMGRAVGLRLANRFARAILELGGNNAAIVTPSADLELTLRSVAYAAMGTAGQRSTTLRRLFVHESVYDAFVPRLRQVYASVSVGSPLDPKTLVGPLIDATAYRAMQRALDATKSAGGKVYGGEPVAIDGASDAYYVRPALAEITSQAGPVEHETFAPILYILRYGDLDAVIELNNAVLQGLSSSIFTNDLREAEAFLSARGSDCGIANVNTGTSGGETGGAFGGEKETGGGRAGGSDAWKAYMRRATNTINYGRALPLAYGVKFDVPQD